MAESLNEIVVVPAYGREALTFLCLEAIKKEGLGPIPLHDLAGHENYGNTGHVLNCLRSAVNCPVNIVHYIENDTIVHPGWFDWAREALSCGNAAVCGLAPSDHIQDWYSAPCASWRADCLRIALSHVTPEYLTAKTQEEMRQIVDEEMFPESRFYRCYSPEHDGFLLRCIEHHGWHTAFPPEPMATHIGFGGYNRPPGDKWPEGTFDEQVAFFRRMLNGCEG